MADGLYDVCRISGLVPPLPGLRKAVAGRRGATLVGPLVRLPFRLEGAPDGRVTLRYAFPLSLLVDELHAAPDGTFDGVATVAGLRYGRFRLVPSDAGPPAS